MNSMTQTACPAAPPAPPAPPAPLPPGPRPIAISRRVGQVGRGRGRSFPIIMATSQLPRLVPERTPALARAHDTGHVGSSPTSSTRASLALRPSLPPPALLLSCSPCSSYRQLFVRATCFSCVARLSLCILIHLTILSDCPLRQQRHGCIPHRNTAR